MGIICYCMFNLISNRFFFLLGREGSCFQLPLLLSLRVLPPFSQGKGFLLSLFGGVFILFLRVFSMGGYTIFLLLIS